MHPGRCIIRKNYIVWFLYLDCFVLPTRKHSVERVISGGVLSPYPPKGETRFVNKDGRFPRTAPALKGGYAAIMQVGRTFLL